MEYKNNYQRKQAIWREKWQKKVEERQRVKALYQPVIDAAISLRKGLALAADAAAEITKQLALGISDIAELLQNPEILEELRRMQEEQS